MVGQIVVEFLSPPKPAGDDTGDEAKAHGSSVDTDEDNSKTTLSRRQAAGDHEDRK
jgi:hypothetical protein